MTIECIQKERTRLFNLKLEEQRNFLERQRVLREIRLKEERKKADLIKKDQEHRRKIEQQRQVQKELAMQEELEDEEDKRLATLTSLQLQSRSQSPGSWSPESGVRLPPLLYSTHASFARRLGFDTRPI